MNLNPKVFIHEITCQMLYRMGLRTNGDEYKSIGTHWIALYVNGNNVTYFDSLGVENIPKETKRFIESKNIRTNIVRILAYDSCEYFCIIFIDFMFPGKILVDVMNILTTQFQ